MKLKKVKVEFEYVIVVENDADPDEVARRHVYEAIRDIGSHELDIYVSAYKPGSVDNWDDECIPYGGDGNTTTGEYL